MSSTAFVRLRVIRKGGPVTYSVHGIKFVAGQWAQVPEVIQLPTGKSFSLTKYLGGLLHTDGVRELFDVTDQAGAEKIEKRELEKEERERTAARLSQVTNTPVARAVKLAIDMAMPDKGEPGKPESEPEDEPDPGAEKFTAEKREEAEAGKPEEGEVEEEIEAPAEDGDKSARRRARAERMAAKAGAKDNPATKSAK